MAVKKKSKRVYRGGCSVVFVTASGPKEGRKIADALIAGKLAACVNMVGRVNSTYWWKGKVERASEVLLIAKTRRRLVGPLISRVKKLHSYAVPEVIALPIEAGNPDYVNWIYEVTR